MGFTELYRQRLPEHERQRSEVEIILTAMIVPGKKGLAVEGQRRRNTQRLR
jgi:hypothetical protein